MGGVCRTCQGKGIVTVRQHKTVKAADGSETQVEKIVTASVVCPACRGQKSDAPLKKVGRPTPK